MPPDERFLSVADRIGARLCRDAVWADTRCNWVGDSMELVDNKWQVAHRSFGPDLYGGTSGIALFLGRMFALNKEREFCRTAKAAVRQALSQLDSIDQEGRCGLYCGLIGVAYVLSDLSARLSDDALASEALRILKALGNDAPNEQCLDVLGGSAGAIPPLIAMRRQFDQDFLLDMAVRHGECLLRTAAKRDIGWSWNTLNIKPERREQDLTGFSHGVAGVVWALMELYRETGENRFRTAAEEGWRYERHWFSDKHGNWPDFRSLYDPTHTGNRTPGYPATWCHGAPGIALSRLRVWKLCADQRFRADAEIALQTTRETLQEGSQVNYSLCHGLAGNAEVLLYANQVFQDEDYRLPVVQLALQAMERYEKNSLPWPCGVLGGGETPGLMLGLAGIGHFYLRLYDPVQNPPVVIVTP
jgi:type 2 lantibiotic biosynthesis protein LanM